MIFGYFVHNFVSKLEVLYKISLFAKQYRLVWMIFVYFYVFFEKNIQKTIYFYHILCYNSIAGEVK